MANLTSNNKQTNFHDRALMSSLDKDELGTFPFAIELAKKIISWPHRESVVMALYGGWGQGKSTVKNIAMEYIEREAAETHIVVRFDPWIYAGKEQLHDAFFKEISRTINKNPGPSSKELAEGFKNWSVAIGGVASLAPTLIAMRYGKDTGNIWKSVLESISPIFKRQSDILDDVKILPDRKSELQTKLDLYGKKILVVIDDIDRLSTEETKQIFQLVKAHADFSNVRYLLLFEKTIVEEALNESSKGCSGAEYLEKIVQIGIHVPKIQKDVLDRYLAALLGNATGTKLTSDARWTELYKVGLSHYFINLRQIHRFLNSLTFHWHIFNLSTSKEINPVDLAALEVCRVFETDIYSLIYDYRHVFAPNRHTLGFALATNSSSRDRTKDPTGLQLEANQLREQVRAKAKNPKHMLKILECLFPGWASLLIEENKFESKPAQVSEEQMYASSRICHERIINKYFYLVTAHGDVPRADIDELLAASNDYIEFEKRLTAFELDSRLEVVLDYIDNLRTEIPKSDRAAVIAGLMKFGERDQERSRLGGSVLAVVMNKIFKLSDDDESQLSLFRDVLNLSPNCIHLPLLLAQDFKTFGEDNAVAKQICLARLTSYRKEPDFLTHPQLYEILRMWEKWESSEACAFTAGIIKIPKRLLHLLGTCIFVRTSTKYEIESVPLISLDGLNRIASLDELSNYVENLTETIECSPQEAIALARFKSADALRKDGKAIDDNSLWQEYFHGELEQFRKNK